MTISLQGIGCVYWSMRTTSLPAARCMANELVRVRVAKRTKLMCRIHRNDFLKTGKIRTKKEADKFYSTKVYRTRRK